MNSVCRACIGHVVVHWKEKIKSGRSFLLTGYLVQGKEPGRRSEALGTKENEDRRKHER